MNGCELVTIVSTLACAIAKDRTINEITILGAIFTQLGDSLATIAATRTIDEPEQSIEEDSKLDSSLSQEKSSNQNQGKQQSKCQKQQSKWKLKF